MLEKVLLEYGQTKSVGCNLTFDNFLRRLLSHGWVVHVVHHQAFPWVTLPACPAPQLVLASAGILDVGPNHQQPTKFSHLQIAQ